MRARGLPRCAGRGRAGAARTSQAAASVAIIVRRRHVTGNRRGLGGLRLGEDWRRGGRRLLLGGLHLAQDGVEILPLGEKAEWGGGDRIVTRSEKRLLHCRSGEQVEWGSAGALRHSPKVLLAAQLRVEPEELAVFSDPVVPSPIERETTSGEMRAQRIDKIVRYEAYAASHS